MSSVFLYYTAALVSSFFVFAKSLSETEILELASTCTPSAANEALYDMDDLAVSGVTSFIVPSKCKGKQFRMLEMNEQSHPGFVSLFCLNSAELYYPCKYSISVTLLFC